MKIVAPDYFRKLKVTQVCQKNAANVQCKKRNVPKKQRILTS